MLRISKKNGAIRGRFETLWDGEGLHRICQYIIGLIGFSCNQKPARAGDRKKLPAIELKTKKLHMHVTELEYIRIQSLYHASGNKTVSDFMRVLVLDENKSNSIINNVELIKQLDHIGIEIGRIGIDLETR